MQRLETKYAVPAAGAVSVAPPPDVVQARSATTAPERRAMPIQRFVPPASPSRAPEPPPSEPETLRSLLEAARLGDKIGAFEDEEIDLDAILEAHRAGDLMDLLREVGLKAGERLRVERALSADPPAPVAAPAEAATEPVPEPVMEPAAEPAAAAEPMPPLPEPVAEPAAAPPASPLADATNASPRSPATGSTKVAPQTPGSEATAAVATPQEAAL